MDSGRAAIPEHVLRLFWDADRAKIDLKHHSKFIICRVLDFGDQPELRWLFDTYGEDAIRQVVASNPPLHPKSLNYWRKRFGLKADETPPARVGKNPDV